MPRFIHKRGDLLVVLSVTVATVAVLSSSSAPTLPRTLLAMLFVFVCPGYVFIRAMFGKTISGLPLLALTLGMSIAVAIVGGVLLHLSPWGLQTITWLVFFSIFIVTGTTISLLRQSGTLPGTPDQFLSFATGFRLRHALVFLVSVTLAMGALGAAREGAFSTQQSTYTQFWILPVRDSTDTFQVGIRSRESSTSHFNLEVRFGDLIIQEWPEITLRPDETWESTMQLPSTLLQADWIVSKVVSASLYHLDDRNSLYRFVTFHFDSTGKP